MKKKPKVCKTCNGTKKVNYRGRTFTCGACSTDPLQKRINKIFNKVEKPP